MSSINATIREHADSSSLDNLILSAQKGDLRAFNELVLLYQGSIFNLALRILGDEESAEDITQITFLAAYRNLARFRNGSFRGWLYRVATNACYDELRRRKRHPVQSFGDEGEVEESNLPFYDFSNKSSLPEHEAERHELDRAIQRALNRLDEDQRTVVVLIDFQNIHYWEASQILGLPIGTVKSRLARARLQLSRMLKNRL